MAANRSRAGALAPTEHEISTVDLTAPVFNHSVVLNWANA